MRQTGHWLQCLRGDDIVKTEDANFIASYQVSFFFTLEHFLYYKKGYFISFHFMYNISLYPLACKQRWVFNMLIARIPSIFKFYAFGKL